jgi:hypothetical protein
MAVTPPRLDLPSEVEEYLRPFAICVEDVLGEELIGSYLQGAGGLGGFNSACSDIDILVVRSHRLTQNQRDRLCQELGGISRRVAATILEISVVTFDT